MAKPTVSEVKLSQEEIATIIGSVIKSLSDGQKDNLRKNLEAGRRINCGTRASIFADANTGCLLTLAVTTDLPEHHLDIKKKQKIISEVQPLYDQIIKEHTLRYYIATALLDEESFKKLILDSLQKE